MPLAMRIQSSCWNLKKRSAISSQHSAKGTTTDNFRQGKLFLGFGFSITHLQITELPILRGALDFSHSNPAFCHPKKCGPGKAEFGPSIAQTPVAPGGGVINWSGALRYRRHRDDCSCNRAELGGISSPDLCCDPAGNLGHLWGAGWYSGEYSGGRDFCCVSVPAFR